MRRTCNTDAKNRMISEWTLPKMIVKAEIQQKKDKAKLLE
jgi:hypothetical protein